MKLVYIISSFIFVLYLMLPNSNFPSPPAGALQSSEPADIETPLRRSYFSDLTREEIMTHYMGQFNQSAFMNLPLPAYRLNYPPEESQAIIRDQTRSTFLEEIVHPFRESIYINGFKPEEDKDVIFVENKFWMYKITVKHVPSSSFVRLILVLVALFLTWLVIEQWTNVVEAFFERKKK